MRASSAVLLGTTLALLAVLGWIDRRLTTDLAPYGIVSLELSWTTERAVAILDEWRRLGQSKYAAWSLGVDFAFPVFYGTLLARACRWVAARRWSRMGHWLAGAAIVAAGLDLGENLALGNLLGGVRADFLAPLASTCATAKFLLGAAVLGFLATGALAVLWSTRRRARSS